MADISILTDTEFGALNLGSPVSARLVFLQVYEKDNYRYTVRRVRDVEDRKCYKFVLLNKEYIGGK